MKRLVIVWLFGLLAVAIYGQSSQLREPLLNPKTVETISADEFRQVIAHHRGQAILVNFWATWCAPCVKEIPEIVKLQEKYKERGLRVIVVSLDEPAELESNVRPFVAKRFPGLGSYLCNESDQDKFASVIDQTWNGILPTNFLIDRIGKLRATLTGGKNYEEFEAALKPFLEENPK
jgi:thiol-disulfide isomerase/thioredoxin